MVTEADTCGKYVLPKLYDAGWTDDQISEQKYFTDGRIIFVGNEHIREPGKKTDYILRYKLVFPIALIEAKAAYKKPRDGLQQAMEDAEILQLKFGYSTNGPSIIDIDHLTGNQRNIEIWPSPKELWLRTRKYLGVRAEKGVKDLLYPFRRGMGFLLLLTIKRLKSKEPDMDSTVMSRSLLNYLNRRINRGSRGRKVQNKGTCRYKERP